MMPLLPNARYERKYVLRDISPEEACLLVRRHPAAFREAYPPRIVNNVYLDSPALNDYHDHVNGAANRHKTRVRWYGDLNGGIANPRLERKLKRGLLSGKVTHPLPPVSLNGHGTAPVLEAAFARASLPESLFAALTLLQPSLFNRYRRRYFLSANGHFRLTLDSELRFASPRAIPTALSVPLGSFLVIELKFAPDHAEEAALVTNWFPFRLARCSKYILGIERTEASAR